MSEKLFKNIKRYLWLLSGACVIFAQIYCMCLFVLPVYAEGYDMEISGMNSRAYCMIDGQNGRVLAGSDYESMYPMASTTKIMTCILALENGNLDDIVRISSYAASMPNVQLNARVDEEYYLGDLLYSLMLESHNDVAVAVAEHIGGSVTEFALMMNEKAKDLGCNNTYYVTPNGLDGESTDENGETKVHSTSAYDLAKIMSYCIKNDTFLKITTTKSHTFSTIDGKRTHTVNNGNALLNTMDGVLSGKTGYTGDAGYCYVCAVKRDERVFAIALLGAGWPPNKNFKWQDVKKLVKYGEENFFLKTIYSRENYIKEIKVLNGVEDSVWICTDRDVSLNIKEGETVDFKYNIEETLNAPVSKGDMAGNVQIFINDKLYDVVPIKVVSDVKIRDFKYWVNRVTDSFFP